MDVLRYGSSPRLVILSPSFDHVYLRGGVPVAGHFSLIECNDGRALNALFNTLENLGGTKTKTHKYNKYNLQ